VEVGAVEYSELAGKAAGEPSSAVRKRVNGARRVQESRFHGQGMLTNAGMGPRQLEEFCRLDNAGYAMMEKTFKAYGLSARAFTRILKVARTIADLEGAENIGGSHLAEAIQYRVLDKKYWGQT
jgi:magnesium chelatase family protein